MPRSMFNRLPGREYDRPGGPNGDGATLFTKNPTVPTGATNVSTDANGVVSYQLPKGSAPVPGIGRARANATYDIIPSNARNYEYFYGAKGDPYTKMPIGFSVNGQRYMGGRIDNSWIMDQQRMNSFDRFTKNVFNAAGKVGIPALVGFGVGEAAYGVGSALAGGSAAGGGITTTPLAETAVGTPVETAAGGGLTAGDAAAAGGAGGGAAAAPSAASDGTAAFNAGSWSPGAETGVTTGGGSAGGATSAGSLFNLKNATQLAQLGIGAYGAYQRRKQGDAMSAQLNALTGPAAKATHQMLQQYNSGKLTPADQQAIDDYKANAEQMIRQEYSDAGMSNSGAMADRLLQVDKQVVAMQSQARDNYFALGMNGLGVTFPFLNQQIQFQMQQDEAAQQTLDNVFSSVFGMIGNQKGVNPTGGTTNG